MNIQDNFGYGCKIKLSEEVSLVFASVYLIGKVTANSNGNNYACIRGLPYKNAKGSGLGFNFEMFVRAIADNKPVPLGYFINNQINIMSGNNRGGSNENWVASTGTFSIYGSGFYFTDQ